MNDINNIQNTLFEMEISVLVIVNDLKMEG